MTDYEKLLDEICFSQTLLVRGTSLIDSASSSSLFQNKLAFLLCPFKIINFYVAFFLLFIDHYSVWY